MNDSHETSNHPLDRLALHGSVGGISRAVTVDFPTQGCSSQWAHGALLSQSHEAPDHPVAVLSAARGPPAPSVPLVQPHPVRRGGKPRREPEHTAGPRCGLLPAPSGPPCIAAHGEACETCCGAAAHCWVPVSVLGMLCPRSPDTLLHSHQGHPTGSQGSSVHHADA